MSIRSFYSQLDPVITFLPDGGFVTIWESEYQDGQDIGIYGQIYDPDGKIVKTEFQVNTTTKDAQDTPSVTTLADGGFVVTWQSRNFGGTEYDIFAQRYDATGNTIGEEIAINTTTADFQEEPQVVGLSDGGFAIAWESDQQDGSGLGIYAQRYNVNSTPIGAEFQVNTYTTRDQGNPAVASLSNGDFIVTWQSSRQDGSEFGIYAQRYDLNGNPKGSEFQVNTHTDGSQNSPAIATLNNDHFIIAWQSSSQDGDDYGIFAQRYDREGNALGMEFQVNTTAIGEQILPSIANLADGGLMITWRNQGADRSGGYDVYAQRYDATGNAVGGEFQLNTMATNERGYADVTGLADGGWAAIWHVVEPASGQYDTFSRIFDADSNPVGTEFQVNTFEYEIPPLDEITPPEEGLVITIAASNTPEALAMGATYRANGVKDQELINQAIAEVNEFGGGTVLLLPGVFNIEDNVLVRSNVELRGSNWQTTLRLIDEAELSDAGIIRSRGASNNRSDIAVYNATLADFQIDGNRENQSSSSNKYGVYGNYKDSLFTKIYIHDTPSYGFDPHEDSQTGRATINLTIADSFIENSGLDGITLDKLVDSLVTNNLTINNARHGINIVSETKDTLFSNNVSIGNGANGITIQTGSHEVDIIDNQIGENTRYGIYLLQEEGNRIEGNHLFRNQRNGILLGFSDNNTVANNLVFDNAQALNDQYSELELSDNEIEYSTDNLVADNVVRSSLDNRARYGIREKSAGENYNTIANNLVTGAVRNDYSIKGANSTLTEANPNLILGTPADDNLSGNNQSDRIVGGAGDDNLDGRTARDLLEGGKGNDTLNGRTGKDLLWGNNGNDVFQGGKQNDYLNGDSGEDTLNGDFGEDILEGGSGNDYLHGGRHQDHLYGREGQDTLIGGHHNDYLWGGGDDDFLEGQNENDYLNGDSGNDELAGGSGDDILSGGENNDTLTGNRGDDFLKGEAGNDLLTGGKDNDYLDGGTDMDELRGDNGDDYLLGGAGDDSLFGNEGHDILQGDAGRDTLSGGSGSDYFVGGSNDDLIKLGNDSDRDTLLYAAGDGIDVIEEFNLGEDLFGIINIAEVDVVTIGNDTQFHIAEPSNFGSGQLLMTFIDTKGFTAVNIVNSLSLMNTASFNFAP